MIENDHISYEERLRESEIVQRRLRGDPIAAFR